MSRQRFLRNVVCSQPYYPAPVAIIPEKTTMRAVVEAIATAHGVTVREILSDNRAGHVVDARHEAMALMLRAGRWSSVQIGRALRRHHTTVLYGAKQHKKREASAC